MSDLSLQNSIRACQRLTALAGSSFVPAFAFLPAPKRVAMEVLYAYTRFTDDLVDIPDMDPSTGQPIETSPRRKLQKMNQWVSILETVFGPPGGPPGKIDNARNEAAFQHLAHEFPGCCGLEFLPALKWIVDEFQVPREPLFHLIDGVESDINPRPFETFEDSAEYCHQVATSVGFASLAIWGTTKPLFSNEVIHAAKACGIAFQWTNILRDLLEDYSQGRVYLPQNELKRVGLTEKQFGSLLNRRDWDIEKNSIKKSFSKNPKDQYAQEGILRQMETFEEKFDKLLQMQIQRCEVYYFNSVPMYNLIQKDSRKVFGVMWSRYYAIFCKIRRRPLVVTEERVSLSAWQKLKLYLRWKLFPCWRLSL